MYNKQKQKENKYGKLKAISLEFKGGLKYIVYANTMNLVLTFNQSKWSFSKTDEQKQKF